MLPSPGLFIIINHLAGANLKLAKRGFLLLKLIIHCLSWSIFKLYRKNTLNIMKVRNNNVYKVEFCILTDYIIMFKYYFK